MKPILLPLILIAAYSSTGIANAEANEKLGMDCKLEGASKDLPGKKQAKMTIQYDPDSNPGRDEIPNGKVSIDWSGGLLGLKKSTESFPVYVNPKNQMIDIFNPDGSRNAGVVVLDKANDVAYIKFGKNQDMMWLNCTLPKKVASRDNQTKENFTPPEAMPANFPAEPAVDNHEAESASDIDRAI